MLNRRALGVLGVSVALAGAGVALVLTPPGPPEATTRGTGGDQAFITRFYTAKERLVPGTAVTPLTPGERAQGFAVGDDYVTGFRDSYADDPDITVESVDIVGTVEGIRTEGERVEMTVEVSMYFDLAVRGGSAFTGGETQRHLLSARRVGNALQVLADRPLGA